jgi:hypothetical protein
MIHFIPSSLWSDLALAGHAEVEVGGGQLLGEQDDLAGVHFYVADDFEDGFEDGGVAPGAGGLRVDDGEQAVGGEGGDDAGGFVERGVEAGGCVGGVGGRGEGELLVALADVGLVGNAVEDPLAHVAFEVQEKVSDGVLVVAVAMPGLVFGELVEAGRDGFLGLVQAGGGVGEEVVGDGVRGHAAILSVDCGRG